MRSYLGLAHKHLKRIQNQAHHLPSDPKCYFLLYVLHWRVASSFTLATNARSLMVILTCCFSHTVPNSMLLGSVRPSSWMFQISPCSLPRISVWLLLFLSHTSAGVPDQHSQGPLFHTLPPHRCHCGLFLKRQIWSYYLSLFTLFLDGTDHVVLGSPGCHVHTCF